MLFVYIFISILAGVSIVVARTINAILAKRIGIFQGTLINYIVGLIFSYIFLFLSFENINILNSNMNSIPLWTYLGGLVGILVIVLSNYITPKISAFYLTLFIFLGQLFLGITIDYFITNNLSIGNILGGFIVVIGLTYNLLIDKTQNLLHKKC